MRFDLGLGLGLVRSSIGPLDPTGNNLCQKWTMPKYKKVRNGRNVNVTFMQTVTNDAGYNAERSETPSNA